jgi:hypothetical protein
MQHRGIWRMTGFWREAAGFCNLRRRSAPTPARSPLGVAAPVLAPAAGSRAQCPCAYPGCAMLLARIGPRLGIRGGELNPVLPCSPRIAVWLLLLRAATSELVEVATMRRRLGPAAVRQRSRSARRRPTGAPRAPQKHLSRAWRCALRWHGSRSSRYSRLPSRARDGEEAFCSGRRLVIGSVRVGPVGLGAS